MIKNRYRIKRRRQHTKKEVETFLETVLNRFIALVKLGINQ